MGANLGIQSPWPISSRSWPNIPSWLRNITPQSGGFLSKTQRPWPMPSRFAITLSYADLLRTIILERSVISGYYGVCKLTIIWTTIIFAIIRLECFLLYYCAPTVVPKHAWSLWEWWQPISFRIIIRYILPFLTKQEIKIKEHKLQESKRGWSKPS